ncbi:RNA-directed DNA polymerase [Shewanella livingstonensis]|uniref:RNA-directed DNA polymerase n=1 Tax=Shewanella livingstonensis TaxID=150120 RepID=A0A3G8LX10_9GAMM|nr:retron St85 family RNA-directed DNA polymerase [Shewanella livingstonensis]AZG73705.1 RNA-directed DNA polymerase [Shewanella livingstonensis]
MELISKVAEHLGLPMHELISNMRSAPSMYKAFSIKKRNGGDRIIRQPSPFVKNIQRAIVDIVFSGIDRSEFSMAYEKGRSIKDNALIHTGADFLLKMDFKDFFPSIKPSDLFRTLGDLGYDFNDLDRMFLSRYLFVEVGSLLELSIGAPSSPMLSNLVMKHFDIAIGDFCHKNSIRYSRYADDLTFSGCCYKDLKKVEAHVVHIISLDNKSNLLVNDKKTRLIGKGRSQRVTGVILTHDGNISVGRNLRKKIRGLVHLYSNKKLNNSDIPYLHGIISHMRNIEPEYYEKLIVLHGDVLFKRLAKQSYAIGKHLRCAHLKTGLVK